MVVLMTYAIILLCIILWCYGYITEQQKYGHIPGPTKWPIFGNMLQLQQTDKDGKILPFQQQLTSLGRQYGDIMWVKIGFTNLIVLNGYTTMYEALVKKGADFADRPVLYRFRAIRVHKTVFGMNYTPTFKAAKNIFHQALRVYGEGVDNLENVVHESLGDLVEKLNAKDGQPVVVMELFTEAFANTIFILVFGRQIDSSKTTYVSLMKILKMIADGFKTNTQGILLDKYPILRHVFRRTMQKLHQFSSKRDDFWTKLIAEHKANWDGEEERCLLDVLLKDQRRRKETQSEVQFSDNRILMVLDQLLLAGFGTSSRIMTGIVLFCLHEPKIQDKLYAEVCSVVGATGQVSIKHKHQLHYTRAVIFEALRYISLVAVGGGNYHRATKDTSIGGYSILKGTPVVMNQWALHHDPDLWTNPWSFQPERYLDAEGVLVGPDHPSRQRLLAFGAGERVCVAEVFALNRLCLFLTTLVQRFHFVPQDVLSLPPQDPQRWQFLHMVEPPVFASKFVPRQ